MTASKPSKSALSAVLLLALPVAIAAALLALRLHFQPPTIPEYSVEPAPNASPALAVVRGHPFVLVARPERPVVGAVAARGFLVRQGQVKPWDPPFDVSREGVIRIAGQADRLFAGVPDGPWEIALAVGRPETLPTAPADVLRGGTERGPAAWRLLKEPVVLR